MDTKLKEQTKIISIPATTIQLTPIVIKSKHPNIFQTDLNRQVINTQNHQKVLIQQ